LQEWSGVNDAGEGMFIMGWKIVLGVLIGVSLSAGLKAGTDH